MPTVIFGAKVASKTRAGEPLLSRVRYVFYPISSSPSTPLHTIPYLLFLIISLGKRKNPEALDMVYIVLHEDGKLCSYF